jgi:glutathione-regulated potassium-efflux system ancillary protein KefG
MRHAIEGLEGVSLRDLYSLYPDYEIDVAHEQKSLLDHDLIVLQHPFYWYSCPAIIKEWLDLVLEDGWAYGQNGTKLAGKFLMSALSTGGSSPAYQPGGANRFEVHKLLAPFDQTAHLCGMAWLEPFVIHRGRQIPESNLVAATEAYRELLIGLRDGRVDPLSRLAPGYELPVSFSSRAA